MQNPFDEELGYSGSNPGSRIGSFEKLNTNSFDRLKSYKTNPFGPENKSYVEKLIHKNVDNIELPKSYELSKYFIISSLGIFGTFLYEILALFRVFTLFKNEEIPNFGLLQNVRSFELFFCTSAVISIFFISLMYHGLYRFISEKWIKMCRFVSKLAGDTFINHTKNCVLEKASQNCQDQEKVKLFGKQFTTALDYAIKEFESDRVELSECSKYVLNKSKCSLCKLQVQWAVLPICFATIAQSILGAYVYYISMYYHRVPLAHPTLITDFRWFAAVQYEGLIWISLQFTISFICILFVYINNKRMPIVLEKHAEIALVNANHFANTLVNRIWEDRSAILNGDEIEIEVVGLESVEGCNLFGCDNICGVSKTDKVKSCDALSNSTFVYPTINDYTFEKANDLHDYVKQV